MGVGHYPVHELHQVQMGYHGRGWLPRVQSGKCLCRKGRKVMWGGINVMRSTRVML